MNQTSLRYKKNHNPDLWLVFLIIFCLLQTGCKTGATPQAQNSPLVELARRNNLQLRHQLATVVIFISAKCPCSDSHIEPLPELALQFPTIDFIFIYANPDEKDEFKKKYHQLRLSQFPMWIDQNLEFTKLFQATKTPHVFVFDRKQHLVYSGAYSNSAIFEDSTENYLIKTLTALKENKPIHIQTLPPEGCPIYR